MSTNYAPPLSSSDGTYAEAFPQFSVLRSVLLPPVDGVWANTAAAYETLPPLLGGLADQLWALRSNGYDHAHPNVTAREVDYRETVFESTNYETEHPVGQVYARTRERWSVGDVAIWDNRATQSDQ